MNFRTFFLLPRGSAYALACLSLSACTVSHVALLGTARPPTRPDEVRVFLEPPSAGYAEIAEIDTSSRHAWAFTSAAKFDAIVARLKVAAARLGANGVVLQEVSNGDPTALAAGAGLDTEGARGPISIGLSGGVFVAPKFARATAIYLEPAR